MGVGDALCPLPQRPLRVVRGELELQTDVVPRVAAVARPGVLAPRRRSVPPLPAHREPPRRLSERVAIRTRAADASRPEAPRAGRVRPRREREPTRYLPRASQHRLNPTGPPPLLTRSHSRDRYLMHESSRERGLVFSFCRVSTDTRLCSSRLAAAGVVRRRASAAVPRARHPHRCPRRAHRPGRRPRPRPRRPRRRRPAPRPKRRPRRRLAPAPPQSWPGA